MGEEKKTIMVLKVDLECYSCYKKVKKVLCGFPQIRDQVFDEKANTVTITVICCSPEKIRDKLCYKGGKAIKSIDIKESSTKEAEKPKVAEKPKDPEKPKVVEKPKDPEKPKVVEKPKDPEKPKVVEKPKEPEKPKAVEKPKDSEKPKVTFTEPEKPKPKGDDKPKSDDKPPKADPPPKQPEPAPKPSNPAPEPGIIKMPEPVNGYPQPQAVQAFPMASYYGQCYDGYGVDPYYNGFGRPVPPPPGPCYDGYGYGNRACYATRCEYINEENPAACSIM